MSRVLLNPSIAANVDIDAVWKNEVKTIRFTAPEAFVGNFTFKIWNSEKKNTEFETTNGTLEVSGNQLILKIDPSAWSLKADDYYSEIYSETQKSIIIKGKLVIKE